MDETEKMVYILGNEWEIQFKEEDEVEDFSQLDCDGYAEEDNRLIVVRKVGGDFNEKRQRQILRHELIHAYLDECGLAENSSSVEHWATNEEMVDWFARMSPRIIKTFKELGIED